MNELRVLAVCGILGYGFPEESLAAGMARQPHVVGADNGSTDPGPYYLGSGDQLTKRPQMVRDLGMSLASARGAGVPLIVGSAGTAGGEPRHRRPGRFGRTGDVSVCLHVDDARHLRDRNWHGGSGVDGVQRRSSVQGYPLHAVARPRARRAAPWPYTLREILNLPKEGA